MILAIADRSGSRNKLENVFRAISNGIKTEVADRENPEVDMFSGPHVNKTKEQVVKQALDKVKGEEVQKSQSRAGLHLLRKSIRREHGRTERRGTIQEKSSATGTGTESSRRNGREAGSGCKIRKSEEACSDEAGEGSRAEKGRSGRRAGAWLIKAHVAAYDRVTKTGALAHIAAHEDSRVKRYEIKLGRTNSSAEVHKLRMERFAHLPHWGSLDEHTKQAVLDAEDEKHAEHKHFEAFVEKRKNPNKSDAPGSDKIDRSGWEQSRLFKARSGLYLLRKSNDKTTITVTLRDRERSLVRLIQDIKAKANVGHSYEVITDPDDREHRGKFGIDGDGGFHIDEIKEDGVVVKSRRTLSGAYILRKSKEKHFRRGSDHYIHKTGNISHANATMATVNVGIHKNVPTVQDLADLYRHVQTTDKGRRVHKELVFAKVSNEAATKIKTATGLNVRSYRHAVDTNGMVHINRRHGMGNTPENETPITAEDIARIPDIVENFDKVERGRSESGLPTILYTKKYEETTYYVEEVQPQSGKNLLMAKTMYKHAVWEQRATSEDGVAHTSKTCPDTRPDQKSGSMLATNISNPKNEINKSQRPAGLYLIRSRG